MFCGTFSGPINNNGFALISSSDANNWLVLFGNIKPFKYCRRQCVLSLSLTLSLLSLFFSFPHQMFTFSTFVLFFFVVYSSIFYRIMMVCVLHKPLYIRSFVTPLFRAFRVKQHSNQSTDHFISNSFLIPMRNRKYFETPT